MKKRPDQILLPDEQKNKKKLRKILFLIIDLIIVVIATYVLFKLFYPQNRADTTLKKITLEENIGVFDLGKKLQDAGVIHDKLFFEATLFLSGKSKKIHPGRYELSPNANILRTIEILASNGNKGEAQVTIVEGMNNREIAKLLAATYGNGTEETRKDFEKKFLTEAENIEKYKRGFNFLADLPDGASVEGYLFPDSYRFYKGVEPEKIIRTMLENFQKRVGVDFQKDVQGKGKKLFETVVLASIVQKEVQSDKDMVMVAGVYANRLEVGRKLESDTTINYITGSNNPQPTLEETKTPSPYNTYLFKGLPPGPICNPGLSAIFAALNPAKHDYLFFLTRLDTGEPIFAKTGAEHLANKKKYLNP